MKIRDRIAMATAALRGRVPDKKSMIDGKSVGWYINPWNYTGYKAGSDTYINDGYAGNSDVFSIVNYTITTASSVKFKAYRIKDEQEIPLEDYHPVARMLQYANPAQPFREYVQAWYGYKLLTGDTYTFYAKPENGVNAGKPVQMTVLPANYVTIETNPQTGEIIGYTIANKRKLGVDEVSHSKYWNPQVDKDGTLYGMAPLTAGLRLLTMSNTGYDASSATMANGGMKGVLSARQEDQWSQENIKRVQDAFNRDYMGAENYGKIMVTSASMGWEQVGVSPADLEIMSALRMTKQQLCSLFRFPSPLLNDPEGKIYNTYKETKKVLYTDLILPDLASLEDQLQREVADPYDDGIVIKMDTSNIEVLQADKEAQTRRLRDAYWIKVSDKQRMAGDPVDESLDFYLVPSGMVPMQDLLFDVNVDEEMKRLNMIR